MTDLEFLVRDLPTPEAATRFFRQFSEKNPNAVQKLLRNEGLMSDVLTLASYSPLLATTMIQSPEYVTWLAKERAATSVIEKAELMESLARFSLTHSQLTPHVLFARFRRRELLRIFLHDIRRQRTVAEITEHISNLADAILEAALRIARQEMDNRYGTPLEIDEKGRQRSADICIVSLGKLGSRELNYSSDIDLLFIYSGDGTTTGSGTRGSVTNREYFVKLAETVIQLIGRQSEEGAAYRVDLRLRPHGRVGALALSLNETVRYYLNEARSWEQQVLIRSRPSAGNGSIYKTFFTAVKDAVFRPGRDPVEALREVYLSKAKINEQGSGGTAFNVKLGRGGIREIEFIAQALQLAYGGRDKWLRVPHTLISISRLADRHYLKESERSRLSNAYLFLRRLEHILQMEHGLQTHTLPPGDDKAAELAAKMHCRDAQDFQDALTENTENVKAAFQRVFGGDAEYDAGTDGKGSPQVNEGARSSGHVVVDAGSDNSDRRGTALEVLEKTLDGPLLTPERLTVLRRLAGVSPRFAEMLASKPWLVEHLDEPPPGGFPPLDHEAEFDAAIDPAAGQGAIFAGMRTTWSRMFLRILLDDVWEYVPLHETRARLSSLAEASMKAAMRSAMYVASEKEISPPEAADVLALGKLGSGTLDYDSDLDLILVYRGEGPDDETPPLSERHSRVVAAFVNFLSGITRDGNLYRVDLRLRPHGKNAPNVTTLEALIDYIETRASVWELLAYVQMRGIALVSTTATDAELAVRDAIGLRAGRTEAPEVKKEALNMRERLEKTHGRGEADIKFSSGGLMDVYFVVRCLQLLHMRVVGPEVRTTAAKLDVFAREGLLSAEDHQALAAGHRFLSELDHNIRLVLGRRSALPRANAAALATISARMSLTNAQELSQQLSLHRMNIRHAFTNVLIN